MTSETLKPCPFCGGENVDTSYKDTFSGDFRRGVYCADCCGGIYPYYDTEAEAIAAWNTREGSKVAVANVTVKFDDEKMDELREEAHELIDGRMAELEQLVRDWCELYEYPDYGDCIRLRKRMAELGIEV